LKLSTFINVRKLSFLILFFNNNVHYSQNLETFLEIKIFLRLYSHYFCQHTKLHNNETKAMTRAVLTGGASSYVPKLELAITHSPHKCKHLLFLPILQNTSVYANFWHYITSYICGTSLNNIHRFYCFSGGNYSALNQMPQISLKVLAL
jgi:hypothetical protein